MNTDPDFVAYVRDLEWAADQLEQALRTVLRLLPNSNGVPAVQKANVAIEDYVEVKLGTLKESKAVSF